MMNLRNRRPWALLVVGALLAACGGGGGGGDAEVAADACAGVPAGELGATGALCTDSGLRPGTGGFSFANWGGLAADDSVTTTTAIAIFGKEAVCAESTDTTCTPFPAVQHWIDAANADMVNGRCEGMAVLSQRLFEGRNTPDQLQTSATKTFDLQKPTVPVVGSIARWWVTQRLEKVIQSSNRWAQAMPSEAVAKLIEAIDEKSGVTLGIYNDGGGGHALTPIAVTKADDGTYSITLYDNNFPDKVTSLSVDPVAERWTYDIGAMNAGAGTGTWTGGKGSMDLTVMADREGDQKVPWSSDDRAPESKGSARISVSTGGASFAGLIIKVGDKTIDSRNVSSVSDGVKVYPNRGGVGTGAMVEIPAGLANVKVTPVIGELLDPTDTAVNLTVGVDAPGPGSQLITDEVSGADLEAGTYDDFSIDVSTDEGYESTVDVAEDGDIEVGVAYEEESLNATLEDGQDLAVADPEGEGDFALDVTSQDGESLYEASYDGVDDDGNLGTTSLDIDEATGDAVVAEQPIETETLNTDLLEIAAADAEVAAAADEPSSADSSTDNSTPEAFPSGDSTPGNPTGSDPASDDSGPNVSTGDGSVADNPATGDSTQDSTQDSMRDSTQDSAPESTTKKTTPQTDPPTTDRSGNDDNAPADTQAPSDDG